MATLEQRRDAAQIRKQIAQDRVAEASAKRYLQFLNDNLTPSRKRKRGWTTPGDAERDLSTRDRNTAMGKARQKVEEHPIVAGMVQSWADNVIGNGFRLSMRTRDLDWNRDVEALWATESNSLDVRGVRRWARLQRCWGIRKLVDGDVGVALLGGPMSSRVQTIEADRIYRDPHDPEDTGIEFDKFGAPSRFFVGPRVDRLKQKPKTKAYDARDFALFCGDLTERAERMRGFSGLIQMLNLSEDYAEILDGIVQKVKNESFIGLVFGITPTEGTGTYGEPSTFGNSETNEQDETGRQRQHVKMVPGMNLDLTENEDVKILESAAPHAEFDEFEKKLISRMAFSIGLTYELVTGDYSGINYTSGRAMMEQAKKRFRFEQSELAHHSSRIFQWWLSRQVKAGTLTPPGSIEGAWWTHRWGVPGWASLNPVQEANAKGMLLDRMLTTRANILADEGQDDIEDVLDQLAREKTGIDARDLPFVIGLPGSTILNADKDDGNGGAG